MGSSVAAILAGNRGDPIASAKVAEIATGHASDPLKRIEIELRLFAVPYLCEFPADKLAHFRRQSVGFVGRDVFLAPEGDQHVEVDVRLWHDRKVIQRRARAELSAECVAKFVQSAELFSHPALRIANNM